MTKYKDILKVEFKDAIAHFNDERGEYHLYRINRLLVNGSLINFDYRYLESDDPKRILLSIDLNEFGTLVFEVNIETSYGRILTENHTDIISSFIADYDVFSEFKKA